MISTMAIFHKTIDMKELVRDQRVDDCHLSASEAEEFLPPPEDNIGRKSKVNDQTIMANYMAGISVDG